MATLFFWATNLLERWDTRVFPVWRFGCGALLLKGIFFLSQHGIGAASILASLSLPIADGSNLGLDIIGTSRWDGKDGNCAAFSLLFSIV